jgi:signal transduction histidine kinase
VRTLFVLVSSVLIAFAVALLVIVLALSPPLQDIRDLFFLMGGTGLVTVLAAYALYRTGVLQHFASLRWTVLATIILTVVLVFVNVWLVAQLMFISYHDLALTAGLLVFSGLIAVTTVFFVSGSFIGRIKALAAASDRLAQGQREVRVPVNGNDEVAQLTRAFNEMAGALQAADAEKSRLEQARRDLIAWVSHDLRAPLAAVRVMHEAILDGIVTDSQTVSRYIQDSQRELDHLSRLIDDLFDLANLDAGHLKLVRERTSLRDLVSDTLGAMQPQAARKQVRLEGSMEDGIDTLYIAPDKIQRVLHNLLDNAIRHTPPGGHVTLRAAPRESAVLVSIHNTGVAIPAPDLPHVFERFYQGGASRTPDENGKRGVGLGLTIARGFVEAHGGRIWVASQPEKGTTFVFSLPRSGEVAVRSS